MTITNAKQPKIKPENSRKQKIPRRITETYLHNSGLYYLQRYATSSANFRTVMLRKVKRSCNHHIDQDYAACAELVEALIVKFEASGLLNDALYLEGMVRSFRRKGLSKRVIIQKMSQKGLPENEILKVLHEHDDEFSGSENMDTDTAHNAEMIAAAIFCRRKRLGAFNTNTEAQADEKYLEKQMSKLARAGFSFDVVKKILSMPREDIEEIAR